MAREDRRLGRGLSALLGDYMEEEAARAAAPEREVSMALIRPNPFQPRSGFEDAGIEELAASIRENGLLQPLVVRPTSSGWELVAGERRWRAARRLGWESVPVVVRDLDDEQMLVLALVENLQREDLSPLEEAVGYRQLMERFDLTQQEVARRVGRDRSTVANSLRLLGLPEPVRELLAAGDITAGHARAILGLEADADRVALAREVAAADLSVRATERRVRDLRGEGDEQTEPSGAEGPARADGEGDDPGLRRAVQILERALGTRVRLRRRSGAGGEIRVRFHDEDDLLRLLDLLAGEEAAELTGG